MRYFLFFSLSCLFMAMSLDAQSKPQTLNLKKGQAFDIILLTNAPDSKEAQDDYFKRAFPIALESGYAPAFGKGIDTPTKGNYHPEVMAFGTWPSIVARVSALTQLETRMTDFHEMRRKVWTNFDMTYYEVKEDISITFDPEKYYVATMFWASKKGKFAKFKQRWEAIRLKQGGRQLIRLTDGASPFGYHFNPTYLTITEWNSEADFRAAKTADDGLDYSGVLHLNQFPLK